MNKHLYKEVKHSIYVIELCVVGINTCEAAWLWASLNGIDIKSINEDPCLRRMPANTSTHVGRGGLVVGSGVVSY